MTGAAATETRVMVEGKKAGHWDNSTPERKKPAITNLSRKLRASTSPQKKDCR